MNAQTETGAAATGATAALVAALMDCVRNVPRDAQRMSQASLLDWIGVALPGAREPMVDALVQDALADGGGSATLVGRSERVGTTRAALINGAASHVLDYDDGHSAMIGHPSVGTLPALLALAEQRRVSGKAFLAAHVLAVEAAGRIGRFVTYEHYTRGYHATATIGAIASALGCAYMLGLDEQGMVAAAGVAGCRAGGLKAAFGTDMKSIQVGWAGTVGLTAAQWAARGVTAPADVLAAEQGFGQAFSSKMELDALLAPAPNGLHIYDTTYKRYAACYGTHPSIEAIRKLIAETPVAADDVECLELGIWRGADRVCNIAEPSTGLASKFSLRGVLTMALLGIDHADPAAFSDETVTRPDFIRTRQKIDVALQDGWSSDRVTLKVRLKDGRELSGGRDGPLWTADVDGTCAAIRDKFTSLVTPLCGASRSSEILQTVENLDACGDMAELTGRLAG